MKRFFLILLALVVMVSGSAWGQTASPDAFLTYPFINYKDNAYKLYLTQGWYYGDCTPHGGGGGIDYDFYKALVGDPQTGTYHIVAAADGTVISNVADAGPNSYGNYVIIEHTLSNGHKYKTLYGHMPTQSPLPEQTPVKRGQFIGWAGDTGWAEGVHLHFELRDKDENNNDRHIDPYKLSAQSNGTICPEQDPTTYTYCYPDCSDCGDNTNGYGMGDGYYWTTNPPSYPNLIVPGFYADGASGWRLPDDPNNPDDDNDPHGYSEQFLNTYNDWITDLVHNPDHKSLGAPYNNNPDPEQANNDYWLFVHGFYNGMIIQDFYSTDNGLDQPHTSLIKGPNTSDPVCLLKEGFWDYYMHNAGWCWGGTPISDEDDFNDPSFPDYTTVQQFRKADGSIIRLIYGQSADPIIKAIDANGQDVQTSSVTCEESTPDKSFASGVYHNGIKIADFGVPFQLETGMTYSGFYAVSGGEQVFINPFTVNGDMTITLGNVTQPTSYILNLNTVPSVLTAGQYFQINLLMDNFPEEHGQFINSFRVALLDMDNNHIQDIYGPNSVDLYNGLAAAYTCMQPTAGQYKIVVQYSLDGGTTWQNFDYMGYGDSLPITITRDSLAGPCTLPYSFMIDGAAETVITSNYIFFASPTEQRIGAIDVSDLNNQINIQGIYTPEYYFPMDIAYVYPYLYVNMQEGVLWIVDISDINNFTLVGSLESIPRGKIAVSGDYAYVAGSSFQVIDISDPTNPAVVGTASVNASNVVISGDYAYVAGSSFQVIDISDPTNPTVIGTPSISGGDLALSGNYVYVTGSSFQVIDVTNPTAPTVVGTASVSGGDVALSGNYAYITHYVPYYGSLVDVIDIFYPNIPTLMYSLENEANDCTSINISGNRLYMGSMIAGMFVAEKHCGLTITSDFTASPINGNAPLAVQFTDQSFEANSWSWDFGDTTTSSEQNPIHIYTTAGTYSVSLTVGNGTSTDSKTITDMIVVQDGASGVIGGTPLAFRLETNCPNPFNPVTVINYSLDVDGPVKLEIYDLRGRKVATLVDKTLSAGSYQASFDGRSLASGVYFSRLTSQKGVLTSKMTLVK